MSKSSLSLSCLVSAALLSACATPPDTPPDLALVAREIIEETTKTPVEASPSRAINAPDAASQNRAPVWTLTEDETGLKHLISGYTCPAVFDTFQMIDDEIYPGLGYGNDVACVYGSPAGGAVKLHVTNFGRDVSLSAHLKGVETSIAEAHRVIQTLPTPHQAEGQVIQQASAFHIEAVSDLRPDIPVHTAVWIDRFGPWHVKVRATYEADQTEPVSRLVNRLFEQARADLRANSHLSKAETIPGE